MKAFVLAAGLGTRLRPFTLDHPKALVPVGGVPMLGRVLTNLKDCGFNDITVNIHHFGEQIIEYLECNGDDEQSVRISDERGQLLETGGALQHAEPLLCSDALPILVHNVDILSNADLRGLYDNHIDRHNDVTLLVSDRRSGRKLVFGHDMRLQAWHNVTEDVYRPADYQRGVESVDYAFSGIYVISPRAIGAMRELGFEGKFSIIDFIIAASEKLKIEGFKAQDLKLIDIGKPETLAQANLNFGV